MSDSSPILFYAVDSGSFRSFSNFYPSRFKDDKSGLTFSCNEQYFMYQKAKFFGDEEIAGLILKTDNPGKAKLYGREVRNFDNQAWSSVREEIMYQGLLLKYRQNPDLRDLLLSTGNRPIAEASPYDSIWGIGADEDDERAQDPENWPSMGLNCLGRMLMKCRETLRAESIK